MQPEKFILSLGLKKIKNWLANTKKSVRICFPAVPNELVETILQIHIQEEKALLVIVSFNE